MIFARGTGKSQNIKSYEDNIDRNVTDAET